MKLDPSRAGEAWAEHKARQADEATSLMRQASSGYRPLSGVSSRAMIRAIGTYLRMPCDCEVCDGSLCAPPYFS